MHFLSLVLIRCCALVLLAYSLVGCNAQTSTSSQSLQIPINDWSRKLSDSFKLRLEISINGGHYQRFTQLLSESPDSWVVNVTGVVADADNSITLNWYIKLAETRYNLATQSGNFFANSSAGSAALTAEYESDQYDHDNDGVSNLREIAQDTFPIQEPQLTALTDPGCSVIGSPLDEPGRYDNEDETQVCLTGFYIGTHEVTFDQYDEYARATSRQLPEDDGWGRGARPVINVSWFDVLGYINWISSITGIAYRLPTEAEWEFAARGGSTSAFNTGGAILSTDVANFNGVDDATGAGLSRGITLPIQSFAANAYGLYDTHGNVFEWTCSRLIIPYDGSEQVCADPEQAREKLVSIRGGSWIHKARDNRSANRGWVFPEEKFNYLGFRVARDL